ncbi:VanZ family protein [Ornithinimicrobium panacihumi]|uniref:VanZ family protein n=1 Tax=Ornithinimicrobium panacihumi TaxID=2008449 RepID=UPI003F8C3989
MPWGMTAADCAGRGWPVVLDPTAYFRQVPVELAGLSWTQMASGWIVVQMVLNVALFVPLGVLGVRWAHWSAGRTILVGAGVSLLVEATQLTGNWFLMPCSYRLADVNDLITNTAGAALGVGVAAMLPELFADPGELRARRGVARPVTRVRRWTAMVLDAWLTGVAVIVVVAMLMGIFGMLMAGHELGPAETDVLVDLLRIGAVLTVLTVAVLPSLVGAGGSLGQRIVHLRPVPVRGRGTGLLRPATLRGLALAALCTLDLGLMLVGMVWIAAEVLWGLRDPRGLSGLLTGHDVVDPRAAGQAGGVASPAGTRVVA